MHFSTEKFFEKGVKLMVIMHDEQISDSANNTKLQINLSQPVISVKTFLEETSFDCKHEFKNETT